MYRIPLLIFILFSSEALSSQNVTDTIRKIAIECRDLKSPNDQLYSALKDYKIICVGELHGTNEPAEFLTALARTFISQGKVVTVGFEIPKEKMNEFTAKRDSLSLSRTSFFLEEPTDGRNSNAWFKALNACNKLGVKFCFFDGDNDLSMFKKVEECYESDTNSILLTLSGNVHNKLLPYKEIITMGCYLAEKFGKKVCSINHIYTEGTAYNRTADGLKVRTIKPGNNAFTTSTNYDRYLIKNIFNPSDGYSAYYYTRTVTASFALSK